MPQDAQHFFEPEGVAFRVVAAELEVGQRLDEAYDGRLPEGEAHGDVDLLYGGGERVADGHEQGLVAEYDGILPFRHSGGQLPGPFGHVAGLCILRLGRQAAYLFGPG